MNPYTIATTTTADGRTWRLVRRVATDVVCIVETTNPATAQWRHAGTLRVATGASTATGLEALDTFAARAAYPSRGAVSVAYRLADGTEGNHMTMTGDPIDVMVALHGILGGHNASLVWATDGRTGALAGGFDHTGRTLTTIPPMQHAVWIGAFVGEFKGNVYDHKGGATSVTPPHARIIERDESHVYRGVRGGGDRLVVVYTADGYCIGYADPVDLGYASTAAMMAAEVCS